MSRTRAKFVFFLYKVINIFLYILTFIFWPKKIKKPKKICIYRIGNIGDILCAIPAIIAIRNACPNAHITLLTSPGKKKLPSAKELLEGAWYIDRLWTYNSEDISNLKNVYQFIKKLRKESFDLWVTLPAELWNLTTVIRNIFFTKLCRVKHACGFVISTIKLWAREQSKFRKFDNEVERLMKLLKDCKFPISTEVHYELPLTLNIQKKALAIIERYQITDGSLFAFVPGAKYLANQWPLDYFVETGRFILQKYPNAKIVIFGGSDDLGKGDYIKNRIQNGAVINLCGQTSLLEAAFILKRMKLIVSNNTGLMHMSALGGTKVIGIFSSAELNGKWFPYGKQARFIMKSSECEGCYYRCINDYNCIKAIKPAEVIEKINLLLE